MVINDSLRRITNQNYGMRKFIEVEGLKSNKNQDQKSPEMNHIMDLNGCDIIVN